MVSVITCTNRPALITNILENFNRQSINDKELIIVINKDNVDFENISAKFISSSNIKIFHKSSDTSLGKCLNFAIENSIYDIIAKFDDDDFYAPNYLIDTINTMKEKKVKVIGKANIYIYFKDKEILAIKNISKENRFVYRVDGSTLVIDKSIFDKIKFRDINLGEDKEFCKDCHRNNIKIYSHNRFNYVYIRYNSYHNHTWHINNDLLLTLCKKVCVTKNFINHIIK
ncbi:glycosyltransferase [Clostridiisalibacter paucivorans]|uniref:glycosyltransferase n=1 Tax=Clostridiisalibacter paucivorans TaxID=408753 RepID=UPI00068594E5|nr:glycosyltransferase [Clostridiisalibacter paucivorans]